MAVYTKMSSCQESVEERFLALVYLMRHNKQIKLGPNADAEDHALVKLSKETGRTCLQLKNRLGATL